MRMVTIFAMAGAVLLAIYTSPYQNQDPSQKIVVNVVLFEVSLFFALTGFFTLFLFWLRRKATGNEVLTTHMGVSFRQGVLLALCIILLLSLQSFRVLTWWDGLLAAGAVMMVEFYFLAR